MITHSLFHQTTNQSLVFSGESTTPSLPAPIQPTTINCDISLQLDTTSYGELQPCPLTEISQSSLPQQKSFIEEETNKNRQDSMNQSFDDHASSSSMDAVRFVINKAFSERDVQLSKSKSSSNRCRGSRLENKVGLNITDDDYVILKLKQKEQKQTRTRKPRVPKDKTIKSCSNKTGITKCRTTAAKAKKANKENENITDPQIAAAVERLQNVICFTQSICDNDSSDEEF